MICSGNLRFIVLFCWSASQGHSLPWMRMRAWLSQQARAAMLTFSVPCLPLSPLSMIHCFLGPFPLHPIDGFQSYLNFHVPTCGGMAGALSLALLQIAQGHRWGEEGGRQNIYQDVLLYFFYPSPRRWFHFSENPLNPDQVRWLLSLETQELSGHNQYKCQTLNWGGSRPVIVFWGRGVVFLGPSRF